MLWCHSQAQYEIVIFCLTSYYSPSRHKSTSFHSVLYEVFNFLLLSLPLWKTLYPKVKTVAKCRHKCKSVLQQSHDLPRAYAENNIWNKELWTLHIQYIESGIWRNLSGYYKCPKDPRGSEYRRFIICTASVYPTILQGQYQAQILVSRWSTPPVSSRRVFFPGLGKRVCVCVGVGARTLKDTATVREQRGGHYFIQMNRRTVRSWHWKWNTSNIQNH